MRKYVAEFIGTCVLTFIACGAASFTAGYSSGLLGIIGISMIFGLCVTAMAYSIGNISGCHINPAVSFGMLFAGRMSVVDFMGYVVAQMLGGIAGAFGMYGLTKTFDPEMMKQYTAYGYDFTSLGTNGYGEASSLLQINVYGALAVEIILTFVFVITILGVTAKKEYKGVAGLVIGMTLTMVHLFGITLTGTSVNPARSFGPALVKAIIDNKSKLPLEQVWVFIVGPLLGAAIAAIVYTFLAYEPKKAVATVDSMDEEELEEEIEEAIEEADEEADEE